MNTQIKSIKQVDNLAIVQFSTIPNNSLEYVTSSFALKNKLIEVKEVSEGGNVNELFVFNYSDKLILLMDGDILSGAKQNRIINTSILLPPQSKIIIPVSCVERGRWSYNSPNFDPTEYTAPANLRAEKTKQVALNLESEKSYRSDQGKIWSKVLGYLDLHDTKSATSNLSDIFDRSEVPYNQYLETFKHHPEANGIIFLVDKKPQAVDIFNRTDTMNEYFPKLLKGIALDVYRPGRKENVLMSDAEISFKALDFLDTLEKMEQKSYPGVALGTEKRFHSEKLAGFELNYNDHLVHMTGHASKENNQR